MATQMICSGEPETIDYIETVPYVVPALVTYEDPIKDIYEYAPSVAYVDPAPAFYVDPAPAVYVDPIPIYYDYAPQEPVNVDPTLAPTTNYDAQSTCSVKDWEISKGLEGAEECSTWSYCWDSVTDGASDTFCADNERCADYV